MRILKDVRVMVEHSTYQGELIEESHGDRVIRLTNFRNGTALALDASDVPYLREVLASLV